MVVLLGYLVSSMQVYYVKGVNRGTSCLESFTSKTQVINTRFNSNKIKQVVDALFLV